MLNNLIYYFKPYLFFIMGFACNSLDHPIKWLSITAFIIASLIIEYWRYINRLVDYEEIEL